MESSGLMRELLPRVRALLPPLQGGIEDLLLPLYQVRRCVCPGEAAGWARLASS